MCPPLEAYDNFSDFSQFITPMQDTGTPHIKKSERVCPKSSELVSRHVKRI